MCVPHHATTPQHLHHSAASLTYPWQRLTLDVFGSRTCVRSVPVVRQLCFGGGDHFKSVFLGDKGLGCILGLLRYSSKRFAALAFISAIQPLLVPADDDEEDSDEDGGEWCGVVLVAVAVGAADPAHVLRVSAAPVVTLVVECAGLGKCEPWSLSHVNSEAHSDVTLVVSPKKTQFFAHKAVLQHHSHVIAALAPTSRCVRQLGRGRGAGRKGVCT